MLSIGLASIGAMLAILGATLAIGHLLGGPALSTRTTLGVTTAFRNSALALLIANLNFSAGTEVISAIAAYVILTFAVVLPYAAYWKRKQVKETTSEPLCQAALTRQQIHHQIMVPRKNLAEPIAMQHKWCV
jgi:hypothetical protein